MESYSTYLINWLGSFYKEEKVVWWGDMKGGGLLCALAFGLLGRVFGREGGCEHSRCWKVFELSMTALCFLGGRISQYPHSQHSSWHQPSRARHLVCNANAFQWEFRAQKTQNNIWWCVSFLLTLCSVIGIFVQAEVPVKGNIFDYSAGIGHLCG